MIYTASRLSEGNKLFPSEIHIEEHGVTVKIPGLFGGESKFFAYEHIASINVDAPMIGYSTVTFYAGGTYISAHGFTSSEVKQMKTAVEQGKSSVKNFSGGNNTVVVNQKTAEDVKIKELEMQQALKEKELEMQQEREEEEREERREREEQALKKQNLDAVMHMNFPDDAKGIYNALNILSLKAIKSFDDKKIDDELYNQCVAKFDQGLKELKFLFKTEAKAEMYYEEALQEKLKLSKFKSDIATKKAQKGAIKGIIISLIFGVFLSILFAAAMQVGIGPLVLGLIITSLVVMIFVYRGFIKKH